MTVKGPTLTRGEIATHVCDDTCDIVASSTHTAMSVCVQSQYVHTCSDQCPLRVINTDCETCPMSGFRFDSEYQHAFDIESVNKPRDSKIEVEQFVNAADDRYSKNEAEFNRMRAQAEHIATTLLFSEQRMRINQDRCNRLSEQLADIVTRSYPAHARPGLFNAASVFAAVARVTDLMKEFNINSVFLQNRPSSIVAVKEYSRRTALYWRLFDKHFAEVRQKAKYRWMAHAQIVLFCSADGIWHTETRTWLMEPLPALARLMPAIQDLSKFGQGYEVAHVSSGEAFFRQHLVKLRALSLI